MLFLLVLLIVFFIVMEHDGYKRNPEASRWYNESPREFLKRFEF